MTENDENISGAVDPEVLEKAKRRSFDASYKLRVVSEADGCTEAGQLGELLRREGLYSSQLSNWRKQREAGSLSGLGRKRGRKKKRSEQDQELDRLRRENERLKERIRQAELIIDVQKRVSDMLGIPLARPIDEDV